MFTRRQSSALIYLENLVLEHSPLVLDGSALNSSPRRKSPRPRVNSSPLHRNKFSPEPAPCSGAVVKEGEAIMKAQQQNLPHPLSSLRA